MGAARRAVDALAWSSAGVAAIAGLLCAAVFRALGAAPDSPALGVAMSGTFFVYNLDRLRDLPRDRVVAPLRTAFVERHRTLLTVAAGAAALAGVSCALRLPPAAWALCAPVLGLGLAHRRLKVVPVFKGIYVTAAWLAITVGMPFSVVRGGDPVAVAAVLGPALLANVAASSVRDGGSAAARCPADRVLLVARLLAAAGIATALGTHAPTALAWVPAAQLLCLALFQPGERYGALAVDGALGAGAVAALVALA